MFDTRRRDLAALTDDDFRRPSWTPVGPGTYGGFLAIRVFDFWVHERDITTPLGRATDDSGVGAELSLAQVENSIGYIVGKKIGVPDGKSITFDLTGPITRQLHVAVNGRAAKVDQLVQVRRRWQCDRSGRPQWKSEAIRLRRFGPRVRGGLAFSNR